MGLYTTQRYAPHESVRIRETDAVSIPHHKYFLPQLADLVAATTKHAYLLQNYRSLVLLHISDKHARLGLNLGLAKALGLAANTGYFTTPGQAFYFGIDSAYIAHDYMITGSLFNEEAPFTSELVPFRLVVETGFALQGEKWKFLFLYKNRSPDNTLQPKKSHHLMTLSLSRFFD